MPLWKTRPILGSEPHRSSLHPAAPISAPTVTDAALRDAYARGRRDERARHRKSPLMAIAFGMAAVTGAALLATAAFRGSFEGGGALVDSQIVTAAEEATPALKAAAQKAGRALKGESRSENTAMVGG